MRLPRRWVGRLQISLLRARHHWLYIVGGVGAVLTVVVLVVDPPRDDRLWLLALTLLTALIGFVTFVADAWGVWHDGRRTYFAPTDRGRLIDAMQLGDACHGWRVAVFAGRRYVTHRPTNDYLRTTPIALELRRGMFEVPPIVKEHVGAILAARFRLGIALYDSVVMRMGSDVHTDGSPVILQRARYFAGECTNETVKLDVLRREGRTRGRRVFSGASLLGDSGVLYDVASSPCANVIGISTLAITTDPQLAIVHQSLRSAQSPGQLAPSGSGSAEPVDCAGASSLQAFVAAAMERELCEECGLDPAIAMPRTLVIGYARDLDRGGKPEFFGVTALDVGYDVLKRSRRERIFVEAIDPANVKLKSARALRAALRSFRQAREAEFSLALHVNLCLLDDAIERDWPQLQSFLQGAFAHSPP